MAGAKTAYAFSTVTKERITMPANTVLTFKAISPFHLIVDKKYFACIRNCDIDKRVNAVHDALHSAEGPVFLLVSFFGIPHGVCHFVGHVENVMCHFISL
jgi:hypothetical protein